MLLLIFICSLNSYKHVSFFKESQPIKLHRQISYIHPKQAVHFGPKTGNNEIIEFYNGYDSFFLLDEYNSPFATVFLKLNDYFELNQDFIPEIKRKTSVIEIYCVFIEEKYNNKGILKELLEKSFRSMKIKYKLDDDCILGLHINPKDSMMARNFAVYVKYGFLFGTTTDRGPDELIYDLEKIFNCENTINLATRICNEKIKTEYLAMYCKLKDFRRHNTDMDMGNLLKLGENLQRTLIEVNS